MTDSDEVTTRHPEDVRVVRETIRHLFPLLDDGGDAADGWSDAYAVVAALDRLSAAPVDDRERVPEGWRVEEMSPALACRCSHDHWSSCTTGQGCTCITRTNYRLVPVSPSVDPEEEL